MARSNGGIIGKSNQASFGKCAVKVVTGSGTSPVSPATKQVNVLAVAGGGAGGQGSPMGGGGGAGGIVQGCITVCGSASVVIGGGAGGAVARVHGQRALPRRSWRADPHVGRARLGARAARRRARERDEGARRPRRRRRRSRAWAARERVTMRG